MLENLFSNHYFCSCFFSHFMNTRVSTLEELILSLVSMTINNDLYQNEPYSTTLLVTAFSLGKMGNCTFSSFLLISGLYFIQFNVYGIRKHVFNKPEIRSHPTVYHAYISSYHFYFVYTVFII